MLSIQDQISRATQAQLASQLAINATLTGKVMDSMQQVADLNLNLVRATLEHSNFAARQLMSAQDSRQFLSLAVAQIRPNATRTLDYGYYLTAIAADAQTDVIKAVGGRIAESNRELIELAEDVRESGPCSIKVSMSFLRSLMDSATFLYTELAQIAQRTFRVLSGNCNGPVRRIAYAGDHRYGAARK